MFETRDNHCLCAAIVWAVLAGQLTASSQTPHPTRPAANPSVAATVDSHTITIDDVQKIALHKYGQEILDNLIDDYLVEHEAARLHVEVSQTEIDNQVQTLARAIRPKTLDEGLIEHHQTLAELREDFRRRLLALKLAAMAAPPGHFVHAHVILIRATSGASAGQADADALAQVSAIQKQLLAGAKFDDLARRDSQDLISKPRGGDIGIVFEGCPVDPAIVRAALQLKAGRVADHPVTTASGYYLIMASSTDALHAAGEDKAYRDAKEQYELHAGGRNLPAYLRELRSKAEIRQNFQP
ncbi:MAG: peptidylprolyl isomerase [Acidobacteriota bacterium]